MKRGYYLQDDRGSASVVTAGVILATASVAIALAGGYALARDQQRAQLSADMAAVAGAWHHAYGHNGCQQAQLFAEYNAGVLKSCQLQGEDIVLSVSVGLRQAQARAGSME